MSIKHSISETFGGFLAPIGETDNHIRLMGGRVTSIVHIQQIGQDWNDKVYIDLFTKHINDLIKITEIFETKAVFCFEYNDKHVYVKLNEAKKHIVKYFENPNNAKESDVMIQNEYTHIPKECAITIKGGEYRIDKESVEKLTLDSKE